MNMMFTTFMNLKTNDYNRKEYIFKNLGPVYILPKLIEVCSESGVINLFAL